MLCHCRYVTAKRQFASEPNFDANRSLTGERIRVRLSVRVCVFCLFIWVRLLQWVVVLFTAPHMN